MKLKTGLLYGFTVLWLVTFSMWVWADLDAAFNRSILVALKHDTERTNKEKLFEDRCQTIIETVGFEDSITGEARKFSCDVSGVGVALYAGSDLGKHSPQKVGQYFIDKLEAEGLEANLYILDEYDHGSHMEFYVNGQSSMIYSMRPSKAIKMIDGIAADAKLVLLHEGRVDKWIHAKSD